MDHFTSDGLELAYIDEGNPDGESVLLMHGFASSMRVNWIDPGWVVKLADAGFRVVAFDHRAHGNSAKPTDPQAYRPARMAGDAAALLDHLEIGRSAVFGYSMGARVAAFAALAAPERFSRIVFGGLGIGLVKGVGNWDTIADALLAPSLDDVSDERGQMFRAFADRTKSDRAALAACISAAREELTPADVGRIAQPTLIGVGTRDDLAGSADELAALMPNARAFDIAGRDHMLAVGDRTFKDEVVRFLCEGD
ncbi:alpha/beta fold hydrolase [Aurantimonas aggregata]|uniref:Alpha/beta fold hydrolase n=1 Tax=Aurantimonas aggregata TaxID=2047720 RepID=A0A6L9MKD0_9HYPH|nr:alpha/beta hydrolase [Aurantimonas aggregata]NDV88086.1 alpha/beta fold hydrolase [Aurantimonas aggregata]